MSVIAWDGKTIAADQQSTCGGIVTKNTKLIKRGNIILGWTGAIDYGLYLSDWYLSGSKRADWPKFQEGDDWCRLVVYDGGLFFYEQAPVKIPVEHPCMAFGSGRDFAMAALYLGKSAREAVEVAMALCESCGVGIDAFEI